MKRRTTTAWRSAALWAQPWLAPELSFSFAGGFHIRLRPCRLYRLRRGPAGTVPRTSFLSLLTPSIQITFLREAAFLRPATAVKGRLSFFMCFPKSGPSVHSAGENKKAFASGFGQSGGGGEAYRGPFCNAGAAFHLWAVRQGMQMAAFRAA